jgi:hypothetical protein
MSLPGCPFGDYTLKALSHPMNSMEEEKTILLLSASLFGK